MADLLERVEAEFENLDALFSKFPADLERGHYSVLEIAGLATLLHNFYNGVENILKQAIRHLNLDLPTGSAWHRDLLEKASEKNILSEATAKELRRYLAFRNFFVHGYAFELQIEKLNPLLKNAAGVYQTFGREIRLFVKIFKPI
jgi:uncharacterized protein YutE (UPF0331/DUF86 family)